MEIEPILRTELRERNLGKYVSKSVQWFRDHIEVKEKTVDYKMFSDAESRRDEWNRLFPFFNEIMRSKNENIIIVSHRNLLSVFNVMFLGVKVDALNFLDIFGYAGGVSFMSENGDGKRFMNRMSDLSYIN